VREHEPSWNRDSEMCLVDGVECPRLIVWYSVSLWGARSETFIRREAVALAALGVDVRVLSLRKPHDTETRLDVQYLGGLRLARAVVVGVARGGRRSIREMVRIVATSRFVNVPRRLAAHIVGLAWASEFSLEGAHLHAQFGWVSASAAAAAANASGATWSVMLHAFEVHDRRYIDHYSPALWSEAVLRCVISEMDQRHLEQQWGLSSVVIRVGVPASWANVGSAIKRERSIVIVGRVVEKKGHVVLLRALAETKHDWTCVVVGDGPLLDVVREQTVGLGLDAAVRFVGWQDEESILRLLDQSWVACLPSRPTDRGDVDGTPVALIEAMARGLPVVATSVGGIPELVGDCGVVVAPGDATALSVALDGFWDASRRDQVGERARERVAAKWTVERNAERLRNSICEAIANDQRQGIERGE
jgi:colanic acid/amylovoran biosynthesis glycosyltransferase